MSKKSIIEDSHTDWERLDNMQDRDIDLSEIPEITEKQIGRAKLRIGGKPIPKKKIRVTLLLDAGILAYFKTKAGGRGYQSLINKTLKQSIREHDLEMILRRVIREEMRASQ